jgi:hypothetical protein
MMMESREKTTAWLLQLSTLPAHSNADVFVAAHAGFVDFDDLRAEVSNARFRAGAEFSHQPGLNGRDLFDYLLTLVGSPDVESFERAIDSVNQRQKLTYSERLSALKHRLAHVFLPVSGDLHAWQEFGFDDVYLQEIYDSYRSEESRLDRARSLLYSEAADDDNVENLISENKMDDDKSWEAIKLLLPPKSSEAEALAERANDYQEFLRVKDVLDSLEGSVGLQSLRAKLRNANTFGDWCKDLDTHLSELLGKLDRSGH